MAASRSLPKPARATARSGKPSPDDPSTWPVFWRVNAPGASSYDQDWIMCETDDEAEARRVYLQRRRGGFPVRLERVSAGPLPKNAIKTLATLRGGNAQSPGTKLRPPPAAWEVRS